MGLRYEVVALCRVLYQRRGFTQAPRGSILREHAAMIAEIQKILVGDKRRCASSSKAGHRTKHRSLASRQPIRLMTQERGSHRGARTRRSKRAGITTTKHISAATVMLE